MRAAIVLASESRDVTSVAAVTDRLVTRGAAVTVVCRDGARAELATAVDGGPRIVADAVPGGGPVAAMRTGFRATSAASAFVTTPGTPPVSPDGLASLRPRDEDARLALVDGHRRPPCGGYAVEPAAAACDTTLAMGSRRVGDVLARLSVTPTEVASTAHVRQSPGTSARGTN